MKKKLIVFMAIVVMLLCASVLFAQDAGYYSIDNNGTITAYTGPGGALVIPSSIGGKPVRSIGNFAFREKGLTSVVIPNGVASIGQRAFLDNQIASIVIPVSVISIGDAAFAVNRLTGITIPGSVKSIGQYAFAQNQLTSVVIPASVTSLGMGAFFDNKLTSISIPGSLSSIENGVFAFNQLPSITIPQSVTAVHNSAFINNLQLTSITIPGNVTLPVEGDDKSAWIQIYNDTGKVGGTYLFTGKGLSLTTSWTVNDVPVVKYIIGRRSAAEPSIYPAPFDGSWKSITRPAGIIPESTVTWTEHNVPYEVNVETRWRDSETGHYLHSTWKMETRYRNEERTRVVPAVPIPEINVTYRFNGKNYTRTTTETGVKTTTETGVFYYRDGTIELDDGIVLQFVNNTVTENGAVFSKQ